MSFQRPQLRNCFTASLTLTYVALIAMVLIAPAVAQSGKTNQDEPQSSNQLPSLENVNWFSPAVTWDGMDDKTTVVLTYVTWCPKCNAWSEGLFTELKKTVSDKPIVVLAISTEEKAGTEKKYMADRNFVGPNIIHGHAPGMNSELGLKKSSLFNYAVYSPDRKKIKSGSAGSFWPDSGSKKNKTKDWVMVSELSKLKESGNLKFVQPELSEPVKNLLWKFEFGTQLSERELKTLKKPLSGPQRESELDPQLSGELPEKIEAYDKASSLAAAFPSTQHGKDAKKRVAELKKDAAFKQELSAKKLFESILAKSKGDAKSAKRKLESFVRRFEGTHYAKLAAEKLTQQ